MNIHNVTTLLEVFDMEKSVAFYLDVLGLELVRKYELQGELSWVMLTRSGAVIMLNGQYEPGKRPAMADENRGCGHRDVTLFFECDDVQQAYAELSKKTVNVQQPVVTHYGMKQVWLRDPDGFQICLQKLV